MWYSGEDRGERGRERERAKVRVLSYGFCAPEGLNINLVLTDTASQRCFHFPFVFHLVHSAPSEHRTFQTEYSVKGDSQFDIKFNLGGNSVRIPVWVQRVVAHIGTLLLLLLLT